MSNQVANHLGDINATCLHVPEGWWNSPMATVFRIESLVVLVAISMLFLAVFGSLRRRRRNFFAQKVVLASYLSISLVSYTLGSMQSSQVKSSMYPIWAISLYILAGSINSITAYSLDDNSKQWTQMYDAYLCMFYTLLIAASNFNDVGFFLFGDLTLLALVKWMQRTSACITASRSWNLNQMVADYMHQEHMISGPSYDAASMKGYCYLVDWPLHKSKLEAGTLYAAQVARTEVDAAHEVIDIEKIWQCKSLSSEQKDICLSFSLFHLLRRRFFGFECSESSLPKTHDFVFKGLFAKKKKKKNAADGVAGEAEAATVDYDWVFKVIEVELAFMYDFFFTRYAAIYYRPRAPALIALAIICFALAPVLLAKAVAVSSSNGWRILQAHSRSTNVTTTTADVVVTLLMFACIALLELLQLLFYWTTIWGRVYLTCRSVRGQGAPNKGSDLPFHIKIGLCISNSYLYWFPQKNKCYWQKKLGQYSLLESVLHNSPNLYKALSANIKFQQAIGVANIDVIHPVNDLSVRWRVSKPRKPVAVELSAQVKEALVQCLERTQGELTNGQSSLLLNRARDLLWACRHDDSGTAGSSQKKENQAQFILTWHIATCYCERETRKNHVSVAGGALKHHIDVATQVSKYCAYLVVNAPMLLPGHHYDTMRVFDAVAQEAVVYLRSEKPARQSESERLSGSEEEIFHKGVRLWEQLKRMGEGTCWKLLADFWVEMLLYVAPSDNVKEHIESLANGGELITHLWALLTHAGILHRPRNIIDIENAAVHHHQPAPPTNDYSLVQPGTVQQQANLLQNVEGKGTPGANNSASEAEEIIEH